MGGRRREEDEDRRWEQGMGGRWMDEREGGREGGRQGVTGERRSKHGATPRAVYS
jgi:L,D-peptidoglycan transpeptidase YkuD (ErfK/YbiS/YcfS/YnhG family)